MPGKTKAPRAAKHSAKPKAVPKNRAEQATVPTHPQPGRVAGYSLFVGRGAHSLAAVLSGGRGLVPCAVVEAGAPLTVTYFRGPAELGRPELELRAVKLHTRLAGVEAKSVLVTGAAQAQGELARVPTAFPVPADAQGELEYWFELETASGETLWDSNFGLNFRLPLGAGAAAGPAVHPELAPPEAQVV